MGVPVQGIHQRCRTVTQAPPGARQQVRRIRHGLHAARHHDVVLPRHDLRAASAIAVNPDRHNLLTVVAGRPSGRLRLALRLPMMTAPAWTAPVIPERSRVATIAVPASAGAGRVDREGSSLPIGVRAPATSTGCGMDSPRWLLRGGQGRAAGGPASP
jgi:hypothetical protein